jgi:LPS-assembly protein
MNRFFTRYATQRVGGAAESLTIGANGANGVSGIDGAKRAPTASSIQPYELLSITLRAKYFFDPTFGGALIPGRRNQFYPLNTFSGFTYGGVPRRFSPVNINVRVRPRSQLFADFRADVDVRGQGGLRNLALSAGLDRRLIKAFQTFYFTRAVNLAPSLAQFADVRGNEPGTLQGSQWSPSIYLGNTDRPGFFGGLSLFFDFQNRPDRGGSSLISSTTTVGYSFDCCAIAVQNYSYDVGLRQENRLAFSFRLNGIGTFGTEQIGQRFR